MREKTFTCTRRAVSSRLLVVTSPLWLVSDMSLDYVYVGNG